MSYIIGITGRAGAGKTTLARLIVKHPDAHRAAIQPFAKPIKMMIEGLLSYTFKDTRIGQKLAMNADYKEKPIPEMGNVTPRQMMQTLGTEWGRNLMGEDFWLYVAAHRAERNLRHNLGMIFDDCRFENEADFIRKMGGVVVGIRGRENPDVPATHASEHGVEPDFWIDNSRDEEHLQQQVTSLVHQYFRRKPTKTDLPHFTILHAILYSQHPMGTPLSVANMFVSRLVEAGIVERASETEGKPRRAGRTVVYLTEKGYALGRAEAPNHDLALWTTKPRKYLLEM